MAASGVSEHDEARRRERGYLKKAYLKLHQQDPRQQKVLQNEAELNQGGPICNYKPSSYDFEVQRKSNLGLLQGHDPESVDRQRRESHYKQMKQDYSAKLPNRYSSTDYKSQW